MQLCRFAIVACLAAAGGLVGCRQNKPPTTKPVVLDLKPGGGGSPGERKLAGGNGGGGGGGAGHSTIGAQAHAPSGQETAPVEFPHQPAGSGATANGTTPAVNNAEPSVVAGRANFTPAMNMPPAPAPMPAPGTVNGDTHAPANTPASVTILPGNGDVPDYRPHGPDAHATSLGRPDPSPGKLGMPASAVSVPPAAANTTAIGMQVDRVKPPANPAGSGSLPLATPAASQLPPHAPGSRLALPSILTGVTDNTSVAKSGDKNQTSAMAPTSIPPASVSPGQSVQVIGLLNSIDAAGDGRITPQTPQRARTILAVAGSTHFAVWTKAGGAALVLPREAALKKVESAGDREIIVMPLPGADRAVWQSAIDRAGALLKVTDWLNDARVEDIRQQDAARRAADVQADRAARDTVGRTFYRAILGDAPTTRPGRTEP